MKEYREALEEANRCLNCKNPMCKKGCPIATKIPEFINEIKNNNLEMAYQILQENNIMSHVCSNVCPFEETCAGKCVKGIKDKPVKIYELEKYVNSWARDNNIEYEYQIKENKNIKTAVIGAGPAGIACAVELAKEGLDVTIFEKENYIGGLLSYGIPGFRLPRNVTKNLEDRLVKLNIEIKTNQELGKDFTIESLKNEGYKAIFIGIGAEIPSIYSLTEDSSIKGIYDADYILRTYNAKKTVENLGNVIVIGGGNVATDCSRAAIRMGAKSVTIVYRRSHSKMPAREVELDEAIKDGMKIIYNTKVVQANVINKKISNVKCIKTKETENGLEDIPNTEFEINADTVVFAIGLKPNKKLLENEGLELENGLLKVDENNQTTLQGVYAGGDVMQSKAIVCKAICEGKKASKSMINYCINENI